MNNINFLLISRGRWERIYFNKIFLFCISLFESLVVKLVVVDHIIKFNKKRKILRLS